MSTWPPPPDLASIKELVRDADTEEFIADGSPADEYDHEAEQLHAMIGHFATADLTEGNIVPLIEAIWSKNFDYDDAVRASIHPKLAALAQQIARFFGPEAQPQVRERSQ
jgi:hypothetical protein